MSSGFSTADREALAKMNEARVQQAREIALLKRQLEASEGAKGGAATASAPAASASTSGASAPHKNIPNSVRVSIHNANMPRAANAVATAKHEAEVAALRKEVATMKRLYAAAQEEHRRQLEAVVLEGVEHEERYRQLIVAMDGKITARDKRIADLRAELAAANANNGAAQPSRVAPVASASSAAASSSSPAMDAATSALLVNQSAALQQILQIASAITSGGSLPPLLAASSKRAASSAKSAVAAKRPRDESVDASTPLFYSVDGADAATVLASDVASEAMSATASMASHGYGTARAAVAASSSASALLTAAADAPKRRGRPPGKASTAAAADSIAARKATVGGAASVQDVMSATARALRLAATNHTNASANDGAAAGSASVASPKSLSASVVDLGPNPVEGYLRARAAGATGGLEATRLATALSARYGGDTARLADDCSAFIISRCGAMPSREAAAAEAQSAARGLYLVPGLALPLLLAAWGRGVTVMGAEACHINHSRQLFALGRAMRCVVEESTKAAASALSSALALAAGPEASIPQVPMLCLIDFLCAYLHARNRERGQAEPSFALEQLLALLHGLLGGCDPLGVVDTSSSSSSASSYRRPVTEMVAHVILSDIVASGEGVSGESAAQYEALCEHAGWGSGSGAPAEAPTVALRGLLSKLRVSAALAPSVGSSGGSPSSVGAADVAQTLMAALRPLIVYAGYVSITSVVDAFSAAIDGDAAAASAASSSSDSATAARHALMQLLATALMDFNIIGTSPDWAAFGQLFSQFLSSSSASSAAAPLSIAHLFVCEAVSRAFEGDAASDEAALALRFRRERAASVQFVGHIAPILASRLSVRRGL